MHRRREGIVGALGHIHMVVRVYTHAVRSTDMGDHFIHIHIRLGTAAGLPDPERKLLRIFTVQYDGARPNNCLSLFFLQLSQVPVGLCGRKLQNRKGFNHFLRNCFCPDPEILQ